MKKRSLKSASKKSKIENLPAWDATITDLGRYKLDNNRQIIKKAQFISKHKDEAKAELQEKLENIKNGKYDQDTKTTMLESKNLIKKPSLKQKKNNTSLQSKSISLKESNIIIGKTKSDKNYRNTSSSINPSFSTNSKNNTENLVSKIERDIEKTKKFLQRMEKKFPDSPNKDENKENMFFSNNEEDPIAFLERKLRQNYERNLKFESSPLKDSINLHEISQESPKFKSELEKAMDMLNTTLAKRNDLLLSSSKKENNYPIEELQTSQIQRKNSNKEDSISFSITNSSGDKENRSRKDSKLIEENHDVCKNLFIKEDKVNSKEKFDIGNIRIENFMLEYDKDNESSNNSHDSENESKSEENSDRLSEKSQNHSIMKDDDHREIMKIKKMLQETQKDIDFFLSQPISLDKPI